tara:strand:+ start:40 stop:603 length:564 start_codon:yes stop_codon:yes gene_type:complete
MKTQNLIIFDTITLYKILEELGQDLNFNLIEASTKEILKNKIRTSENYLILTQKKISKMENQLILNFLPIKILKLVEKINIEFLRNNFSDKSKVKINNYVINLNSREMILNEVKIKLTEKEVNTIIYLSKSTQAVSVEDLEENVWQYQPDIETHTVETHIYRLRKKILKNFKDNNFIVSKKNGYQIN